MTRLYAYLIPESYRSDELRQRKATIFINTTIITTLFAAFFLMNTLVFDMHYHIYSMLVCTIIFSLLVFSLRWGMPIHTGTHIFVGIAVIATFWDAYFLGGLQSYDLPWICMAPVLAILIGNSRIGWIWLAISLAAVLILGALQLNEKEFLTVIDPEYYHLHGLNSLLALVLIMFFIVLVMERAYTGSMAKLDQKNRIIEKAYADLKATQAQLVHAEKMASLGELTAGIAHEIKNPLNFVNNFSEVSIELMEEMSQELKLGSWQLAVELVDGVKQNLEKINHHGKRADAIVKGMLQHSRTSSGQKELTDLNALADEYLRLAYHGLRAKDKSFNTGFKTDFDPDLPKIEVIPQDIGRVLLNLINNAFYAVSTKSQSNLSGSTNMSESNLSGSPASNLSGSPNLTGLTYDPTVTVITKNLGDHIEIRVKDNGDGIPDEIKDKIFQPFFTTKPTGEGTGLGLSLSYDIITKGHGGELTVETVTGEGSNFKIILPL
jgi:signal transduction histidine kinase